MSSDSVQIPVARSRIRVQDAAKSYDGRTVVDVRELVLGEHPVEGLIGPNGAGKTTLMRLVMHSTGLDRGRITLLDGGASGGDERELSRLPPYRIARLGVVKSNQAIQDFDRLTIFDSLMLAVASHEDERPYRTASDEHLWRRHGDEVSAYTDRFGLGRLDRFAMSAGEKKLLDIIRCLLLKPKVLLLDEPTAGLPGDVRDAVMAHICELAAAGQFSVVIVEHDLDVIWTMTDYVHFMAEGEVVLHGEPAWIRQHETVVEKYLGSSHARG